MRPVIRRLTCRLNDSNLVAYERAKRAVMSMHQQYGTRTYMQNGYMARGQKSKDKRVVTLLDTPGRMLGVHTSGERYRLYSVGGRDGLEPGAINWNGSDLDPAYSTPEFVGASLGSAPAGTPEPASHGRVSRWDYGIAHGTLVAYLSGDLALQVALVSQRGDLPHRLLTIQAGWIENYAQGYTLALQNSFSNTQFPTISTPEVMALGQVLQIAVPVVKAADYGDTALLLITVELSATYGINGVVGIDLFKTRDMMPELADSEATACHSPVLDMIVTNSGQTALTLVWSVCGEIADAGTDESWRRCYGVLRADTVAGAVQASTQLFMDVIVGNDAQIVTDLSLDSGTMLMPVAVLGVILRETSPGVLEVSPCVMFAELVRGTDSADYQTEATLATGIGSLTLGDLAADMDSVDIEANLLVGTVAGDTIPTRYLLTDSVIFPQVMPYDNGANLALLLPVASGGDPAMVTMDSDGSALSVVFKPLGAGYDWISTSLYQQGETAARVGALCLTAETSGQVHVALLDDLAKLINLTWFPLGIEYPVGGLHYLGNPRATKARPFLFF